MEDSENTEPCRLNGKTVTIFLLAFSRYTADCPTEVTHALRFALSFGGTTVLNSMNLAWQWHDKRMAVVSNVKFNSVAPRIRRSLLC